MKRIDMSTMRIVHLGREWPYQLPPYHKSMARYLEKNERLVYWLQPEHIGSRVEDQIPALKLADGFYSLSLRIMKCIYRNIRLKKGFRNRETAQLGGYKLRIPKMLLSEKTRTQARFSVILTTWISISHNRIYFNNVSRAQTMRSSMAARRSHAKTIPPQRADEEGGAAAASAKSTPLSAANKVTNVVFEFFLPVADRYFPLYTPFTMNPDVEEQEILERISDVFPECMNSKDAFVDTVGGIYERGVIQPPSASTCGSESHVGEGDESGKDAAKGGDLVRETTKVKSSRGEATHRKH